MYKAIFIDLDGTLLDDKKNISQENLDAINYAKDNGKQVFICTGRQYSLVEKYVNEINPENYLICCNGAEILEINTKEELFSMEMNKYVVKDFINYCIDKDAIFRLDTKYARYINKEEYILYDEIPALYEELYKVVDEDKILQFTILFKSSIEREEFKKYFIEKGLDNLIIDTGRYEMQINGELFYAINLVNKNVSKGNALNGLCKYLKLDLKDVIFCGDDYNDISAIENAGLGVAMGNSLDEVKEVADIVTLTNEENGVAEIIYKYLIDEEEDR